MLALPSQHQLEFLLVISIEDLKSILARLTLSTKPKEPALVLVPLLYQIAVDKPLPTSSMCKRRCFLVHLLVVNTG